MGIEVQMNILNEGSAIQLSHKLVSLCAKKLGDPLTNADFAKCLSEVLGRTVSSDFGWNGIQDENTFLRTIVIWNPRPFNVRHIALNSEDGTSGYSAELEAIHTDDPEILGEMILKVWNARITDMRKKFSSTREVVLIKSDALSMVSFFDKEMVKFLPEEYEWEWNHEDNLDGYLKGTGAKKFTWQPHGSQFTIITNVPENRLKLRIRRPTLLDREEVLTQLKFDPSWVEIVD